MPEYRFHGAADSLLPLLADLKMHGEEVAPRGMPTLEIRGVTIRIEQPHDCLMVGVGRKINLKLAALEALQLIGGQSYPELMRRVAPQTAQFMDGGSFHGAYGPRIRRQLKDVQLRLKIDQDSRQGVATIWDPAYDGDGQVRDTPCTVYMNFMIRDGKLVMHTHMRSNDVWWGWCYDVTQFCALQVTMAHGLGVRVGEYVHVADSFHMYHERDFEAIEAVTEPEKPFPERKYVRPLSSIVSWEAHASRARELLRGAYLNKDHHLFLEDQAWRIHNE